MAEPTVKWYRQRSFVLCVLIVAGILAIQASVLAAMGRVPICTCGLVKFWYPDSSGPETSQHLTDWYTFSHVLHGLIFYFLLWLIAPRMPFWWRLAVAVGVEAVWEIAENTPMVIDRYRQSALAEGYFGDSIVNSLADTFAAIIGFVFARLSPVWASIALLLVFELFVAYMIRDNLTLNIIQLIHPTEAISRWQVGG
ncbi:DUF2585 domain-containing protein [Chelativorans xinjiangense]|uniref:DUF2585 domain-containing protein n=1 Tax=Chelativorans xinjiangense TaxID=2681485 RepID=UPI001358FA08|nr:DUF2585 domain-containing protein [Chelativorans xinjiangense]